MKVQKRDGSIEDFERKKILLVLIRAGTPPDQAERILNDIESWLNSQNLEVIPSSDIRLRIINILKRINPQAARGYKLYRKSQALK